MTSTLTTTDLGSFSVAIIPSAQQAKADAIATAKAITAVASAEQQADAIAASSLMKGLLRDVEKSRVAVKEPVLDAGRKIDAAAKAFATDLDAEVKRVERLASDWQAGQNRIAAALRAEEERRQQAIRDAEAADRARAAAEIKRLEDEAYAARQADLARIAAAADEVERQKAQEAADVAAAERAEEIRNVQIACIDAAMQQLDAERERAAQMISIPAPKAAGATVRVMMDYELKDIRALYAARPDLVELTPRRALILAAISIPNQPAIPGLYVFEQTKVQSKAS